MVNPYSLKLVLFFGLISCVQSCSLPCLHGGEPNNDCTSCINCEGAWIGQLCDKWDTNVPFDNLFEQLLLIAGNSSDQRGQPMNPGRDFVFEEAEWKKRQDVWFLPSSVGSGVDITTGTTKLPILELDYSDANNVWKNSGGRVFRVPVGTKLNSEQTASTTTEVLLGMYDYIQYLYNFTSTSVVDVQGIFSKEPDLVQFKQQYFSGDSYMTVSKWAQPIYSLSLGSSLSSFKLEPRAKRALDFLPPDYSNPTNQALYRTFILYWGTHVVSASTSGGMINLEAFFQQSLMKSNSGPFTKQGIQDQAAKEFYLATFGDGNFNQLDQTYASKRTLGSLTCMGGNAAELCSKDQLSQWKSTIDTNPVPLILSIVDFTELISEPTTRANIKQAISDFLAEVREKWTVNYPTCPECAWGTCKQGETTCTCFNDHITGVVCDQCKPGWMNNQCVDAICTNPCYKYGGKCVAPDTCKCYWPFYGKQCLPVCGDGIVQPPEQCDYIGPDSCCFSCRLQYGKVCREAKGVCDVAEKCQESDRCPRDELDHFSTCHHSQGVCDVDSICNGITVDCPNPINTKIGQVCRNSRGQCELPAKCEMGNPNCPPNNYKYGVCNCPDGKLHFCGGFQPECSCF